MNSYPSKINGPTQAQAMEMLFRCPVCHSALQLKDKSMVCQRRHCFDIAKQGYVNLLTHALKTKYDKALFDSRRKVIDSGFYEPLLTAIRELILENIRQTPHEGVNGISSAGYSAPLTAILDAGCGEGSHLSELMSMLNDGSAAPLLGVGLDIAKEGVMLAARKNPESLWCVGDLAQCPFQDGSFRYVLNLLSPSNYGEFGRILAEDGLLIKVIPESGYLQELRQLLYRNTEKETYSNAQTIEHFGKHFSLEDTRRVTYVRSLDPELFGHLVRMTPLAWGAVEVDRLAGGSSKTDGTIEITVDLTILVGTKLRDGQ